MLSEAELRELSPQQRAQLLRTLIRLDDVRDPHEADYLRRRRMVGLLLFGCCLVLLPWTVWLALTLPVGYRAGGWRGAWTGFDVGLLIALAVTAWAAWRSRQIVILGAVVSATLLLCDAWFDIVLSWHTHDEVGSVLSAALVEVPLAVVLVLLAGRLIRLTAGTIWRRDGHSGPTPPVWRLPLMRG